MLLRRGREIAATQVGEAEVVVEQARVADTEPADVGAVRGRRLLGADGAHVVPATCPDDQLGGARELALPDHGLAGGGGTRERAGRGAKETARRRGASCAPPPHGNTVPAKPR